MTKIFCDICEEPVSYKIDEHFVSAKPDRTPEIQIGLQVVFKNHSLDDEPPDLCLDCLIKSVDELRNKINRTRIIISKETP